MPELNVQDLIAEFVSERERANQANESRYAQLVELLQQLQGRATGLHQQQLGMFDRFGQKATREAREMGQQRRGTTEQDLISRGLGNTTIRTSALRDVGEQTQDRLQDIAEQVAAQKAGVLGQQVGTDLRATGMLAGAIEGRTDQAPNLSQFAQLIRAAEAGDQQPRQAFVGGSPRDSGPGFADRYGSGSGGGGVGGSSGGGSRARTIGPGAAGGGGQGTGARTIYGSNYDPQAAARLTEKHVQQQANQRKKKPKLSKSAAQTSSMWGAGGSPFY